MQHDSEPPPSRLGANILKGEPFQPTVTESEVDGVARQRRVEEVQRRIRSPPCLLVDLSFFLFLPELYER